ncbi:MAG: glycerophosphodiester phosphodiesterase [Bacteroidales bacterium]
MLKSQITITIILAGIFFSCAQQHEEPDNTKTRILGHRGSGKGLASGYQENTASSVKNAFDKLHGAEVDIQCSKDSTIWLFHDGNLPENEQGLLCIPSCRDAELEEFAKKDTAFTLSRLEEVFRLMVERKPTPFISLDIKGAFSEECFQENNAPDHYFDMIAQRLSSLLKHYELWDHVLVETNYTYFLDKIKITEPQIECYLLGFEDFRKNMETVLKKSYDGLSYNFHDKELTKKDIEAAKRKGLKIQLWSLYEQNDLQKALSWKPDFIQTGRVNISPAYLSERKAYH